MRRFLLISFLLCSITLAGGAGALYVMRDQLLLREARLQAQKFPPWHVEIGALRTQVLGGFSLELGEVSVHADKGPSVRMKSVRMESAMSLLALYRAYSAAQEIPLTLTVDSPQIKVPAPATPTAAGKPSPWPASLPLPASPAPVNAKITVKNGEVSGAYAVRALSLDGSLRAKGAETDAELQASLSAGLEGAETLLPVSFGAHFAVTPDGARFDKVRVQAAGLEGTGTASLTARPVGGKFNLFLEAADLSRVNLRAEDRAAFGLTAQPSGAFSLKIEGEADHAGTLTTVGIARAQKLLLALRAPERTAFAGIAKGQHVDGPIAIDAEIPFRVRQAWPYGAGKPELLVQRARAAFDLTGASLVSKGSLEKARGVPLRGELQLFSSEKGLALPSFDLTFHALHASGSATLPAPLGSSVSGIFKVQISSLAGFPSMLPMLREAESQGAALADAQGAIQTEGSVRILPDKPASSMVNLTALSVRGLKLPLAYAGESIGLRGVLTGTVNGGGKYDAGDINVSRSSGSFDLTGLDISVPGKFAKKRGKKLAVAFDAQGTPTRLQVRKFGVAADGLSTSLSGTAAFDKQRNASLNLQTSVRAELAPLREYMPKLPFQVTGGSFDGTAHLGGTWMPADGIEKSPLTLSGKFAGKLLSVTMPEAAPAAAPAAKAPAAALLPPWPIARNANLAFKFELGQFQRGALVARGIAANGTLNQGQFTANATVAQTFGGHAALKNVHGSLLHPELAVRGSAAVEGLDLAQAAAFVDPAYGKIVKGTLNADSTFAVPNVWGDDIMTTATAAGTAQVHNGYLSTATFDGLINEKLKGIPGVGDKAKVNTGGVAAEIRTAFSVAGGTATLKDFVAVTPKQDEMRLAGSMNLAFDCDLSGEAHLTSAPVTGPIREANSDPQGRLVVPVRFHGNLKNPQADVATNAVQTMIQRTAAHELEKKKNQVVDEAKKKAQGALQDAAGGLLDQFKKNFKR